MEQIVICLLMVLKLTNLKTKDSEITAIQLGLGNISKDFSVDNMRKTGFYGFVYDFMILLQSMTCQIFTSI